MSEAEDAADLFQQHRDELGFVNRAQCRNKNLYTEYKDNHIVGAALVNHCVQKPQTTLYDIAVRKSHRGNEIGSGLITEVANDSPHKKIVAKCPVNLPANQFYHRTGWQLNAVVEGENRPLSVWEYTISHE